MLMELFATLFLLAAFAILATLIFRSVIGIYQTTAEIQNRTNGYESATRQMRADAWTANRIVVINPRTAELNAAGAKIVWRIDESGALVRTDGFGGTSQWAGAGQHLAFGGDSTSLILNEPGDDPALATRFTSQVLLGGGVK